MKGRVCGVWMCECVRARACVCVCVCGAWMKSAMTPRGELLLRLTFLRTNFTSGAASWSSFRGPYVYVCVCIYTYTHTHTHYIYIYICMVVVPRTLRVCVCAYICSHVYTYVYIGTNSMYVCMYVCMYACMYACMHVCMYVYHMLFVYMYIPARTRHESRDTWSGNDLGLPYWRLLVSCTPRTLYEHALV
jgi:hypothetical protein